MRTILMETTEQLRIGSEMLLNEEYARIFIFSIYFRGRYTIQRTITSIGPAAFSRYQLTEVVIPDSVTRLENCIQKLQISEGSSHYKFSGSDKENTFNNSG